MKNMKNLMIVAGAAVLLASCSVSGPLMLTNNAVGSKRGEASYKKKFISFKDADCGIITAARNGGIKKVATVDWKVSLKKGFVTVVTGE